MTNYINNKVISIAEVIRIGEEHRRVIGRQLKLAADAEDQERVNMYAHTSLELRGLIDAIVGQAKASLTPQP